MSEATAFRNTRRHSAARLLPAALFVAAGAGPAAAQDRPREQPTRDVSMTYRLIGGPPGLAEMRMSWLTAENRLRVELPSGLGWMLVDRKDTSAGFMVLEAQRAVMPLPPGAEAMVGMSGAVTANGRFTRAGGASHAGHSCTVWRYEGEGGATGESCVTEDGVLLRAMGTHGGQTGGLEATQVNYGPQDPARFRRPDGYRAVQLPTAPPATAAPQR